MDRLVCMTVDSTSVQKRQKGKSAREALLDAAFDEMYLHGFRAAGIEVILATSGVSKGALYHNFGNKQGQSRRGRSTTTSGTNRDSATPWSRRG
jgi:hypothetical protein